MDEYDAVDDAELVVDDFMYQGGLERPARRFRPIRTIAVNLIFLVLFVRAPAAGGGVLCAVEAPELTRRATQSVFGAHLVVEAVTSDEQWLMAVRAP